MKQNQLALIIIKIYGDDIVNRRKTKTERELIADMSKSTLIFCDKQGKCKTCPLTDIKNANNVGCMVAYLMYLLDERGKDDESDM